MSTQVKAKSKTLKTNVKSKRTITVRANIKRVSTDKPTAGKSPLTLPPIDGEQKMLSVKDIDFSPINYRKLYSQEALESFATELAVHGIISPLSVRQMPSGRYQLIAGERRLRASKIAGLKQVPVIVKVLTDEQVTEIQLAENLQRENPHPLHESQAVAILQSAGHSIETIAKRLGKTKAFIYSRIKLAGLIAPIQEMFIEGKVSIQEAFDIAALTAESQQEFFNEYCEGWQNKTFRIYNLRNTLDRFKYDLKNAPFNTRNKSLVPQAGACSNCPFNSATLKSLFPEMAKEAVCSNKDCFKNKCLAQAEVNLRKVLSEQQPQALLITANIPSEYRMLIDSLPETTALPEYSCDDITVFDVPQMPDRWDYTETDEDDNEEFDENGFNAAMQEYDDSLAEYINRCSDATNLKGLYIKGRDIKVLLFSTERPKVKIGSPTKVTAKEVQDAIKAGNVTPELLEQEIERIESKETRAKEIDHDKIQLQVHEIFKEGLKEHKDDQKPTAADLTGARLVIYQSLDWENRRKADSFLFGDIALDKADLYQTLANLTEEQFCFLIRLAVAAKSESQYPNNVTGYCLYQMATDAGFNVISIEQAQAAKCADREAKINPRIEDLKKRIEELRAEQ
jgi:ParB family chromosome partitioning protein